MKQRLILFLFGLMASLAHAAPSPLVIINSPTANPQIDAVALVNNSLITVNSNSLIFETTDTVFYTNAPNGVFSGFPGFRFETVTNSSRHPAAVFQNQGSIFASGFGVLFGQTLTVSSGGRVEVSSTNVINPGTIDVGSDGQISITGRDVDLSRGTILAGGDDPFAGAVNGSNNPNSTTPQDYINPSGVTDLYWAGGTNQSLRGGSRPLVVAGNPFPYPTPRSPAHDAQYFDSTFQQGLALTNVSVPSFGTIGQVFNAYVYNQPGLPSTNQSYTIVFVATNAADSSYSTAVRFFDASGQNNQHDVTPVIEFSLPDTVGTTGVNLNNLVYFMDRMQVFTNSGVTANLLFPGTQFRPQNYTISRGDPNTGIGVPQQWSGGVAPNSSIQSVTYFASGYSNAVVSNFYSAYQARIDGKPKTLANPSVAQGRVEIVATNLNLTRAQIRAENYISIVSSNLVGSSNTFIDAPVISYNLANVTNTFVVTNLIPSAVRRFNGTLTAWSGLWTNFVGSITIQYHVLILDASGLQGVQGINTPDVLIRSTNVVANNLFNPTKSFRVDSPAITFGTGNFLDLTSSSIPNLISSNFPNLYYFTNLGTINLAGEGHFASTNERPDPYKVMVNRGIISGTTHDIRTEFFDSSGIVFAQGGPIKLTAGSGKMLNSWFQSVGDINIQGGDLKMRSSTNVTFTTLTLSFTNSLTDNGSDAGNIFYCNFGFNLLTKPASGDLLGSTFTSEILGSAAVPHVWAGQDRGAVREGFLNNVALGRLRLASSNPNALFSFIGAGVSNALYVDYLELDGVVSNNVATLLDISPNMKIYFANANVSIPSLDGALGGRLRWVKNYVGANSGVDVVLPSGQTVQVNIGLLNSTTIDSDNDGKVNAIDDSPFDGVVLKNTITFVNVPPLKAQISWDAAAETVYTVEYSTTLTPPNWQFLLNYTNSSPTNGTVTVMDTVSPGAQQRYYRVLYNPGL